MKKSAAYSLNSIWTWPPKSFTYLREKYNKTSYEIITWQELKDNSMNDFKPKETHQTPPSEQQKSNEIAPMNSLKAE